MIAETWQFIHELGHVSVQNIEEEREESENQKLVVARQM